MIEAEDFKITENAEESFWNEKKKVSEELIKSMEKDLIEIPKLISFHKEVVKMCEVKQNEAIKK